MVARGGRGQGERMGYDAVERLATVRFLLLLMLKNSK